MIGQWEWFLDYTPLPKLKNKTDLKNYDARSSLLCLPLHLSEHNLEILDNFSSNSIKIFQLLQQVVQ